MSQTSKEQAPLFEADGRLRREIFEAPAFQLIDLTLRWLTSMQRATFLPIDLLTVLVQQREPTVLRTVARLVRGSDDAEGLAEQLAALARRIDRRQLGEAQLHVDHLSLGFIGILTDAWDWAGEAGRERIAFRDLVRVVRWRAEYQESASIRWALRQLIQPGGERIFDSAGNLLEPLFTPDVLQRFEDAVHLSCRAGLPFLGTPHLVAAFCSDRRGILWRAAEASAIDPLRLRDELLRIVGSRSPEQPPFPLNRRTLTPRVVRMLLHACEQAEGEGRTVSEADLLDAFLDDGGSSLDLVRGLGIEPRIRERLQQQPARAPAEHRKPARVASAAPGERDEVAALDLVGRDLTAEAREGRLPDVVGREQELQRVINVLLRTEQRNPLLTGEPGVGKTAIAMALARQIHEGRVPRALRDMRVVEINGASLVGGTSYRGELEERINQLLREAEDNVILFMDEAHTVFAPSGSGGRPAEVPNHFKAALASGRIAVVAATTDAEYHRWFEQDPALKRRFERIVVDELPAALTRRILGELAGDYQERYDVTIPPDTVDAVLEFSTRFMPEQSQPDKAKKLLMDTAIAVSADQARQPDPDDSPPGETPRPTVTRQDVAAQLSIKTGVPPDRALGGRLEWWRGLRDRLNARVEGQASAIESLAEHLIGERLRNRADRRPEGVFIFVGPPNADKEQLARALAEDIFGSSRAVLKLDMTDFQEPHSLSRLIGTPPGYVGYQDEDALVTPLRRRPAQLVYLSDFNAAHPQVRERLLRMFEDGEITDTRGLRADCRHAIFVLGVDDDARHNKRIGFHDQAGDLERLERINPELAQRARARGFHVVSLGDQSSRDPDSLGDRIRERLASVCTLLAEEYDIELTFDDDLVIRITGAVTADAGTRRIDEAIQQHLIRPVVQHLLGAELPAGLTVAERDERVPHPPS